MSQGQKQRTVGGGRRPPKSTSGGGGSASNPSPKSTYGGGGRASNPSQKSTYEGGGSALLNTGSQFGNLSKASPSPQHLHHTNKLLEITQQLASDKSCDATNCILHNDEESTEPHQSKGN